MMLHQCMSMRKKLLFRHSGKTRERREDHRSQEKKFTSFKVWNERRKDHRDLSQKERKFANFRRIKQIQETQFTSVYKPILL